MLFISDEKEIIYNKGIVSIYFYTSWMPVNFHKKIITMASKVEDLHKDIKFIAADCEYFKGLPIRFSIKSVPTFINFIDGKEHSRITGLALTSAFKNAYLELYKSYGEENGKKRKS